MDIITPLPYIFREDMTDWCASCGYLRLIVDSISPDGIEPMEPLCADCSDELRAD